jgi:hypothetical protein
VDEGGRVLRIAGAHRIAGLGIAVEREGGEGHEARRRHHRPQQVQELDRRDRLVERPAVGIAVARDRRRGRLAVRHLPGPDPADRRGRPPLGRWR